MADVVVAVATFRRPRGLERLLTALANLKTSAEVAVIVADNDSETRAGEAVCVRMRAKGYRWKLDCIVVPERGIAQARNALVERVLATSDAPFIAMLDDDEWPAPEWLEGFRAAQRETGADALHGTIFREFDAPPGAWASNCPGVETMQCPTGPLDMIPGTGNAFVSRTCIEKMPKPCFDPGFALTGGEDKDFFTRLKMSGKRFAWADEAVCYAHVPESRANLKWALKRSYRVGNSDLRVIIKNSPKTVVAGEVAKVAGVIALFPFLFLASLPFEGRRAAPLCKLYRAAGKIAALFGNHYAEYATVHGH
jgi:succinoglycan biosynthesis protein ExoM